MPADILAQIGHIAIEWAALEHNVDRTLFYLMSLNAAIGKIAASRARVGTRLDIITDLIAIKSLKPKFDLAKFRRDVDAAKPDRDAVTHGVWHLDEKTGTYYLAIASGNWPKNTALPVRKRSVFPEAREVNATTLGAVRKEIQRLGSEATELYRAVVISDPPKVRGVAGPPQSLRLQSKDDKTK